MFAVYGQLPSYRAMMDREGVAGPADPGGVGIGDLALPDRLGDLAPRRRQGHARPPEQLRGGAVRMREQPEQQVLGADGIVQHPFGFIGRVLQHALA